MRRSMILAAVLTAAAVLFTACGQPAAPATTAAPAETAAPAATAPETTAPETTEAAEEEVRGVIVDGAMHTILVQTEKGELLEIHHRTDDGTDPDMVGLKEGILVGQGVLVTGTREKDGELKVTKLADAGIACEDPDAMQAAIDVFFSFRARNMESLADRLSYPLTVGKDAEVTSEDELKEQFSDEKIFTEALVKAVTGTDLTTLSPKDGRMALPGSEGAHVVMEVTDDGWAVTEIRP